MPNSISFPKISFNFTSHRDYLEIKAESPHFGEANSFTSIPAIPSIKELGQASLLTTSELLVIGHTLYDCLTTGGIDRLVSEVLNSASRDRKTVHFELRFDPKQVMLTQYPWELIANDLGGFLVRDGLVNLTRYISYPQPPTTLEINYQESLLRIISNLSQLPQLTTTKFPFNNILNLKNPSFRDLQSTLLIDRLNPWGLHFDGHGALMVQCSKCDTVNYFDTVKCSRCGNLLAGSKTTGVLAFKDNENSNNIDWVSAYDFGSILYNSQVKLAFLLSCESAVAGDQLLFRGLAPGLILAGVPAVIGMQFPVLDNFANDFAYHFYTALLQQNNIIESVKIARRMSIRDAWYCPALYMRYQDKDKRSHIIESTYQTRKVDIALPKQAEVATPFLVRLWIRKPKTKALSHKQLKKELGLNPSEQLNISTIATNLEFKKVEDKKLRLGVVEVEVFTPACEVVPNRIKLFIDDTLDAPPAIFVVTARTTGYINLIFNLLQDEVIIASIPQLIEILYSPDIPGTVSHLNSVEVELESRPSVIIIGDELESTGRGQSDWLESVDHNTTIDEFQLRDPLYRETPERKLIDKLSEEIYILRREISYYRHLSSRRLSIVIWLIFILGLIITIFVYLYIADIIFLKSVFLFHISNLLQS